jgi:acyl-coenzyme A thioesterase PaaI-like protein
VVHKSPDLEEIATDIGTHHQLLGLVHEPVAAAALEKLGIRAAARELSAGGGQPGDQPPPEVDRAGGTEPPRRRVRTPNFAHDGPS